MQSESVVYFVDCKTVSFFASLVVKSGFCTSGRGKRKWDRMGKRGPRDSGLQNSHENHTFFSGEKGIVKGVVVSEMLTMHVHRKKETEKDKYQCTSSLVPASLKLSYYF